MEIAPEVIELEDLAKASNVSIFDALADAGVASSTYWRWRNEGRDPTTPTLRKVRAAIRKLAEDPEARA